PSITALFVFLGPGARRAPHSFPTRRSSDLGGRLRRVASCHANASRDGNSSATWAPAWPSPSCPGTCWVVATARQHVPGHDGEGQDRKSTRLNSSHGSISYAVFCLKKKKQE